MAVPSAPNPLPQLTRAPLQHQFRRFEDFCCWTQPLFRLLDQDQLDPRTPYHSSHRSINLGAVSLSCTQYNTGIRLHCSLENQVLFTLNGSGNASFEVKGQRSSPRPGAGVIMVTPTEGHYVRGEGGGIILATRPETLLQTALAIQGPMAMQRLRQRLQEPLQFFAYGPAGEPSLPRSLLQSLHLVDSLLAPPGTIPAALRLDDLICRQLVLMLCPELTREEAGAAGASSSNGFELLLEWMVSHVAEPISLSQLERRSGYSRRTLQRAFQERFGCGPMQWLRRRRLELALGQLSNADATDTVSTIALRCGYLSLANFSRDFSRAYGRSPAEILRANRGRPAL
jgi:AraC-like DNA-binding protein